MLNNTYTSIIRLDNINCIAKGLWYYCNCNNKKLNRKINYSENMLRIII